MKNKVSTSIMFIIFVSVMIAFLGASGTGDRQFFIGWIENVVNYGIRRGFAENHDMYPPLAPLVLYIMYRVFSFAPNAMLFAIRISTALFMLIYCAVCKILFRDDKICYLLFFSTFVSATDGYLDVFIVPFALLSYYMIRNKKYILTGLFLTLMCLMKYQPLIIMPIVAAGFVSVSVREKKILAEWSKLLKLVLGAIGPLLIISLIYGGAFYKSIYVALFRDSSSISPNGLNFGWLVQFFYELATGGIAQSGGQISIMNAPFKALISFKLIFIIGYIVIFARVLLSKDKSVSFIIKNCLIVYILYYLFSTNVHENHFFVGVILALLLYIEERDKLPVFVSSAYMFNINLLIFYGIWGGTGGFNRMICGG